MPDRTTCSACGHEDWANEMFAQAGPTGVGMYCRNHNTCRDRVNARYLTNRKKTIQEIKMQFGTYEEPVKSDGDDYKPREHYGNSAIVKVLEYKDSVVTPNSPNGAPAIIADVYDLNKKAAYHNILMMTGALVDGFKAHAGKNPVVVKWEKRTAANGRTYATAIPASEAAIEAAKAVYANGDPFLDLGTVEEEMPF